MYPGYARPQIKVKAFARPTFKGTQQLLNLTHFLQVGDLVLYFEIDSFIPNTSRFWELFSSDRENIDKFRGKEGFRVKSKWHGKHHLSQGLVYPLVLFPEINVPYQHRVQALGREAATTELLSKSFARLLEVEKWEYTETAESLPNLGPPPGFIYWPGWARIQNRERSLFSNNTKVWQITEKLDGVTMIVYKLAKAATWATYIPDLPADCPTTMQDEHHRYGVCTRHEDMIDRDDNVYWQAARQSGVLDKIHAFGLPNVAVHGEFVGAAVEGNTMHYPDGVNEFVVFGVWNIDTARYLEPRRVVELCDKLGIKHVPVVGYSTLKDYARDVEDLLRKADGVSMVGGIREGFVFKTLDGAEQFKAISNRWLGVTGK